MNFTQAVKTCLFDKFFTCRGRASRSEYWWFMLFAGIIQNMDMIFSIDKPLFSFAFLGAAVSIFQFLLIIPAITVSFRRGHDLNKSGWLMLIPIISLYWACKRGTVGKNQHGECPLMT